MAEESESVSIDDLSRGGLVELFRHIDEEYQAASEAMARGDMEAWVEHAGRGAELFEEAARLNGWRD